MEFICYFLLVVTIVTAINAVNAVALTAQVWGNFHSLTLSEWKWATKTAIIGTSFMLVPMLVAIIVDCAQAVVLMSLLPSLFVCAFMALDDTVNYLTYEELRG